jgi:hypothetical protein
MFSHAETDNKVRDIPMLSKNVEILFIFLVLYLLGHLSSASGGFIISVP